MESSHPYQRAFDDLAEKGEEMGKGQSPYRLLHRLAKCHGIYMHHSRAFIGKTLLIKKNKMIKMARLSLTQYTSTGILQIPDEFKYSDKSYLHDGQPQANRSIWRVSNFAQYDMERSKPMEYTLNTVDGANTRIDNALSGRLFK